MKITYEFDPYSEEGNDRFELSLIQHSYKMYDALSDIKEYIRQIDKGWIEDDRDKITDIIGDLIYGSNMHLIEDF